MKSNGMVGTSIRLPKELRAEASRIAKQDHRSFGQLARIAIEQYVAKRSKKVA